MLGYGVEPGRGRRPGAEIHALGRGDLRAVQSDAAGPSLDLEHHHGVKMRIQLPFSNKNLVEGR